MKLSAFKNHLQNSSSISFQLPDGSSVAPHFHITEVGVTTKDFIDCGGTMRSSQTITLQIWLASDTNHRLLPEKLLAILAKATPLFNNKDLDIEVEYQTETIGIYSLDADKDIFLLTAKYTDCLAKDACGLPQQKKRIQLSNLANRSSNCCTNEENCC